MLKFKNLFPNKCSVIGMVHAAAFPGTPLYGGDIEHIADDACKESEIYLNHKVDGIIIENMHDVPYIQSKHFGPEVVAIMTKICTEVRRIVPKDIACGIQILAGGNKEAIAVAKACDFNFIRSEGFVFSHIADEGLMDADAGLLLRYRKNIHADDVLIFTDIKKKHSSHMITNDITIIETAHAAEFCCSDGIILTGTATGNPASVKELQELKQNYADAVIIGSHFKKKGNWKENVSSQRVGAFMKAIQMKRLL